MVELEWVSDLVEGTLTCTLSDELHYTAHGGGREGYTRVWQGTTSYISYSEWPQEKAWILAQCPDRAALMTPTEQQIELIKTVCPQHDHSIGYPHGVSARWGVLDRMGRCSTVQSNHEGWLFSLVVDSPHTGLIVTADGEVFWRILDADSQQRYNMQACCVFPHNPGPQRISLEEAAQLALADTWQGRSLTNNLEDTAKYFRLN